MITGEMMAVLAQAGNNYTVSYNCHSKVYTVEVGWLDIQTRDKDLDAALRQMLVEMGIDPPKEGRL